MSFQSRFGSEIISRAHSLSCCKMCVLGRLVLRCVLDRQKSRILKWISLHWKIVNALWREAMVWQGIVISLKRCKKVLLDRNCTKRLIAALSLLMAASPTSTSIWWKLLLVAQTLLWKSFPLLHVFQSRLAIFTQQWAKVMPRLHRAAIKKMSFPLLALFIRRTSS